MTGEFKDPRSFTHQPTLPLVDSRSSGYVKPAPLVEKPLTKKGKLQKELDEKRCEEYMRDLIRDDMIND